MAYFVSESLHLKLAAKVSYSTCEEERKRERERFDKELGGSFL